MKKNSLCVATALFGLDHASVVVAEGAQQLSAEQSARSLPRWLFMRDIWLIRTVI